MDLLAGWCSHRSVSSFRTASRPAAMRWQPSRTFRNPWTLFCPTLVVGTHAFYFTASLCTLHVGLWPESAWGPGSRV